MLLRVSCADIRTFTTDAELREVGDHFQIDYYGQSYQGALSCA